LELAKTLKNLKKGKKRPKEKEATDEEVKAKRAKVK
jgi:hypothetical protein